MSIYSSLVFLLQSPANGLSFVLQKCLQVQKKNRLRVVLCGFLGRIEALENNLRTSTSFVALLRGHIHECRAAGVPEDIIQLLCNNVLRTAHAEVAALLLQLEQLIDEKFRQELAALQK